MEGEDETNTFSFFFLFSVSSFFRRFPRHQDQPSSLAKSKGAIGGGDQPHNRGREVEWINSR